MLLREKAKKEVVWVSLSGSIEQELEAGADVCDAGKMVPDTSLDQHRERNGHSPHSFAGPLALQPGCWR